jgi:FAD:protein FMN transferase
MTLTRRRFLAITAASVCSGTAALARSHSWTGHAFGSDVRIELSGPRDQVKATLDQVIAQLRAIERLFSLYDPSSQLSRLNQTGHLKSPAPEFQELIALCSGMHTATQGVFDPSIQPLWSALAQGTDTSAARQSIGWERVRVAPGVISLAPGQALTFNGIAQGFATDLVRAELSQRGFKKALINIGEYAALGGPFTLGLSDPLHGHLGTRRLTNTAIATSSTTAMSLGKSASHIQHPTTNASALWSTVSVKTDQAAIADATSTAFSVMSRAEIRAALGHLPMGTEVTLVDFNGDIETLS